MPYKQYDNEKCTNPFNQTSSQIFLPSKKNNSQDSPPQVPKWITQLSQRKEITWWWQWQVLLTKNWIKNCKIWKKSMLMKSNADSKYHYLLFFYRNWRNARNSWTNTKPKVSDSKEKSKNYYNVANKSKPKSNRSDNETRSCVNSKSKEVN